MGLRILGSGGGGVVMVVEEEGQVEVEGTERMKTRVRRSMSVVVAPMVVEEAVGGQRAVRSCSSSSSSSWLLALPFSSEPEDDDDDGDGDGDGDGAGPIRLSIPTNTFSAPAGPLTCTSLIPSMQT